VNDNRSTEQRGLSNAAEAGGVGTAVPTEGADESGSTTPCLRCGYNLRGLRDDGRCPECGLAVARSAVSGDDLGHAPPGWLASLAWGARIVCFTMAFMILWGRLIAPLLLPTSLEWDVVMSAPLAAAFAAGVWLLSRPQPRFGASGPAWRWSLRAAALSPLLQTAFGYYVYVVWGRVRGPDAVMWTLVPLPLLLLLHLRRLALGALNRSLSEHCAIVGVGGSVCLAVLMTMMFRRPPAIVEVLASAGVMLFYVWGVSLLLRFAMAFGRAHRASLAAWGGAV
jgi:hypothetical protein